MPMTSVRDLTSFLERHRSLQINLSLDDLSAILSAFGVPVDHSVLRMHMQRLGANGRLPYNAVFELLPVIARMSSCQRRHPRQFPPDEPRTKHVSDVPHCPESWIRPPRQSPEPSMSEPCPVRAQHSARRASIVHDVHRALQDRCHLDLWKLLTNADADCRGRIPEATFRSALDGRLPAADHISHMVDLYRIGSSGSIDYVRFLHEHCPYRARPGAGGDLP